MGWKHTTHLLYSVQYEQEKDYHTSMDKTQACMTSSTNGAFEVSICATCRMRTTKQYLK